MPLGFVDTDEGTVLMANGLTRPVAWDGVEASTRLAGVEPCTGDPGIFVVDSGVGDITGEYACFVRFVDKQGRRGLPCGFSNTVTATGASHVVYQLTLVSLPTEANIVRRQILRNIAGEANVYYVDIDTTDLSSTSFTSTRNDEDLSTQESQIIQDEDGITRYDRYYRPFDTISHWAYYNNRVYGAGHEAYSEGSAAVTYGSRDVTGAGTPGWSTDWRFTHQGLGRLFSVPNSTADAQNIHSLTESTGPGVDASLITGEPLLYTTNPFSRYTISPQVDLRNTVYFSEANAPESWHPANAFTVPEDGDRVTALIVLPTALYIMKQRRAYRLSSEADPIRDGFLFPSIGRGCANHRTFVTIGELAYVMDEEGIYVFDGRDAQPISMPIQDLFKGTSKHGLRINWKCQRYFHAVHSPAEQSVLFFVVLSGAYLPHHCLGFCYTTNRWWIEEYEFGIGASFLSRFGDTIGSWKLAPQQVYLAGEGSRVYARGQSALDGLSGWNYAFDGEVLEASPVRITPLARVIETVTTSTLTILSGRGVGQTRRIAENTDGELIVDRPFSIVPDPGDKFGIGVIPYRYLTHRLKFTQSESQDEFSIRTDFDPQDWGSVGIRQYVDHSKSPQPLAADLRPQDNDGASGEKDDVEVRIDLTRAEGYAVVRGDRHGERDTPHARSVRVELLGASGPTKHTFSGIQVNGVEGP